MPQIFSNQTPISSLKVTDLDAKSASEALDLSKGSGPNGVLVVLVIKCESVLVLLVVLFKDSLKECRLFSRILRNNTHCHWATIWALGNLMKLAWE